MIICSPLDDIGKETLRTRVYTKQVRTILLTLLLPLGAAAQKTDSTVWTFDSLESIGGMKPVLLGHPRVVDSAIGKITEFNGKDDAIFLNSHPLAGATTFTWEVLFRPDHDGAPEQRFFHLSEKNPQTGTDTQVRMLFETRIRNGRWCLDSYVYSTKGGLPLLNCEKLHALDKWFVATVTYDGKKLRNYVNGELQGEGDLQFAPQGAGHSSIGTRINRKDYFKGAVRMSRFTRRALQPSEFLKPPAQ